MLKAQLDGAGFGDDAEFYRLHRLLSQLEQHDSGWLREYLVGQGLGRWDGEPRGDQPPPFQFTEKGKGYAKLFDWLAHKVKGRLPDSIRQAGLCAESDRPDEM